MQLTYVLGLLFVSSYVSTSRIPPAMIRKRSLSEDSSETDRTWGVDLKSGLGVVWNNLWGKTITEYGNPTTDQSEDNNLFIYSRNGDDINDETTEKDEQISTLHGDENNTPHEMNSETTESSRVESVDSIAEVNTENRFGPQSNNYAHDDKDQIHITDTVNEFVKEYIPFEDKLLEKNDDNVFKNSNGEIVHETEQIFDSEHISQFANDKDVKEPKYGMEHEDLVGLIDDNTNLPEAPILPPLDYKNLPDNIKELRTEEETAPHSPLRAVIHIGHESKGFEREYNDGPAHGYTRNSGGPRTWGFDLRSDQGVVWNDISSKDNGASEVFNHDANNEINKYEEKNEYSMPAGKMDREIQKFLEDVLNKEEFWSWLGDWSRTYVELVSDRIADVVKEQVSKHLDEKITGCAINFHKRETTEKYSEEKPDSEEGSDIDGNSKMEGKNYITDKVTNTFTFLQDKFTNKIKDILKPLIGGSDTSKVNISQNVVVDKTEVSTEKEENSESDKVIEENHESESDKVTEHIEANQVNENSESEKEEDADKSESDKVPEEKEVESDKVLGEIETNNVNENLETGDIIVENRESFSETDTDEEDKPEADKVPEEEESNTVDENSESDKAAEEIEANKIDETSESDKIIVEKEETDANKEVEVESDKVAEAIEANRVDENSESNKVSKENEANTVDQNSESDKITEEIDANKVDENSESDKVSEETEANTFNQNLDSGKVTEEIDANKVDENSDSDKIIVENKEKEETDKEDELESEKVPEEKEANNVVENSESDKIIGENRETEETDKEDEPESEKVPEEIEANNVVENSESDKIIGENRETEESDAHETAESDRVQEEIEEADKREEIDINKESDQQNEDLSKAEDNSNDDTREPQLDKQMEDLSEV